MGQKNNGRTGRPKLPGGSKLDSPQIRVTREQYERLTSLAEAESRAIARELSLALEAWLVKKGY